MNEQSFPRRRWWLPSISIMIWLVVFLWLNLSADRWMLVGTDSDTCWHWQQGNWILQHRAVLRTEVFSHTRAGLSLIDLSWLTDIVMAAAGNLFRWSGIVFLAAAVCATYLWMLHRQLVAEGNELLLATALVLLAAAVCEMHWLARPHLATHLLVVVFAWQLRWFDRDRITTRRLLILLPLLTALWANLHGEFVMAFVLIGIYLIGTMVSWIWATADRRPALRHRATVLVALGAACVLASMVNPYGWKLLARVVQEMSSPAVVGFPQENLPPNFHDPIMRPFLLFGLVCVLMMPICRPYLSATDALLLIAWFLLSLRMARNAPLFALIATPILAEHWNEYLRSLRPTRVVRWYRKTSAILSSLNQTAAARGLPALAVAAMILVLAKPTLLGGRPLLRTELPADRFPAAAVEFLRQSPDAVHGNMFNEYTWGGYLIWALPEKKVFIHPNLNVYGVSLLEDFIAANKADPGWQNILKKYGVGWTILPREHPLNRILGQRADWRLVYSDAVTTVYTRSE